MPDDSQWTNAIMPGQDISYDGESPSQVFNPFSYGSLASLFNMGMGNIGGEGDNYQYGFDNSQIQNLTDQGYSFQGRYGDQGENGYYGQMLKDGKVVDTRYNSFDDSGFGSLINLAVGGVLGGAPFLGGGSGLASSLGFGGAAGSAINGAATGATIAGGNDQNVLKGAISGGLGGFAAGSNFAKDLGVTNPIASKAINSGLGTTVGSVANGRSLGDSLKSGLTSAGMSGTTQALNQLGGSLFGGYGQQGNTNMSGGFGDLWNSWTGGGQQALPDSLEGSMGPVEGQTDVTESSYDPGASNYRYAGDQVPNLFGSQLPQQQQEVGQKQAMGFSMPSMGNLGNFLSNNAGNLASLLYGVYNNRKQQNAINGQMNNLQGMFGQNSPYAAQLRNKLMAQAAAKGTRSNVAGREVQLQAALAQNAAGLAPSLYNMQNAKNGLQNNQMNMLLQGGRMLAPGLQSLFGQQQQPPAFQADANTMGGLW